ncbi:MAG: hypothetical protein JO086_16925 [Acidimicrobiia bacterium]|nr:hypothetical protein [Acidimicrobiia bacterium]
MRNRRLPLLVGAVLALTLCAQARAQTPPTLQPNVVIDGPSASSVSLGGVSLAHDGGGGVAYLKSVGGVAHVFVSVLQAGAFGAPLELDSSLSADSSQPVIAAGSNGLLLVAFINGGQLYVVSRASSSSAFGAPQALAAGASNPAIAVSIHDKGYLAFTADGAGGHDVRAAYYYAGQWAVESAPLDASPSDDAGTGTGRPRVAAAGDGIAIVVWGESGHVYSRRVWGTSPSIVFEQADPPSFAGVSESSADLPAVAAGDDSSYGYVAFHEVLSGGGAQQSRVLLDRLRGSRYEGAYGVDGLDTPGGEGATEPEVALSGVDDGFVTSVRDSSFQIVFTRYGNGGDPSTPARLDSLPNASMPYAVPATTGAFSGLVAWQHDPGAPGPAEIRVRYYDGTSFGAELVASSPSLGPTDAAAGLGAAGDGSGNMAVAWVQGTTTQSAIVAALLLHPPGSFAALSPTRYTNRAQPVLRWSQATESWGPVLYTVTVDGIPVAQTTRTELRLPKPLPDGPHTWIVSAANRAGGSSTTRQAGLFIDTVAPIAQLTLSGKLQAGGAIGLRITDADVAPPPLPASDASGIARVLVSWGDGTRTMIVHGARHSYGRAGHYKLTVTVFDRAGNSTVLVRRLRIVAKH